MAIGLSGFQGGVAHHAATGPDARSGREQLCAARSAAGFSLGAPFYRQTGSNTGSGAGDSLRQVPGDGPPAAGDAAPARPDSELPANSLDRLAPVSGKLAVYFFSGLFGRHPALLAPLPGAAVP
jgi:hypothetical protein